MGVGPTGVLVGGTGVFDGCIVAIVDWGALQDTSVMNKTASKTAAAKLLTLLIMTHLPMRFYFVQNTL